MPNEEKKPRRSPSRINLFIRVAIFAFLVFSVVMVVSQQLEFLSLEEKSEAAAAQIDALEKDVEEIRAELDAPFDDKYVERKARELLGYHLPDEILYYNSLVK